MTAYDRLLDALRGSGRRVITNGGRQARAQCPAHDDNNPSLSITATEGRVLMHCHAGCNTEDVLAALDKTLHDLYDEARGNTFATYVYPGGRRVHRTADKAFPQSGKTKGDRSLFHADRLGDATVAYVVEGEEDVYAVEARRRGCRVCGDGRRQGAPGRLDTAGRAARHRRRRP